MANPIVQRLIAAGASPARANAFAAQFQKSVQAKSPSAKLVPADYNDAFDLALEEQSKELFPNAFRPPKPSDSNFLDYAEFVLSPEALATIKKRAFAKAAPNFNTNLGKGGETIAGRIAINIANGYSPQEVFEFLQQEKLDYDEEQKKEYDSLFFDISKPLEIDKNATKFVDNLYTDYTKAQEAVISDTESLLNDNRDYKFGIPDKKLKYGYSTNLKKGTIGVDTIPKVKEYFAKTNASFRNDPNRAGASQAGGIAIDAIVKRAEAKGLTPNKDEQQRRFDIKYNRL